MACAVVRFTATLLVIFGCCFLTIGQNLRSHSVKESDDYLGPELSIRELARQNNITHQILQNYLERRLFPHLNRTTRVPTISDILPRVPVPFRKHTFGEAFRDALRQQDEEDAAAEAAGLPPSRLFGPADDDALQSVESERVSSFYEDDEDCPNCIDEPVSTPNRWTMPLLKLGEKRYYLGIFFRANWYRAAQYCRFHGMHLASISSQEENDKLEKHIRDFGLGQEHFWTSGTDLAEEGSFFWMATGRPITFTNWNAGEPNNFRYENGEEENCLELWNRDGKGLKWNDSPCSFETFFVCEVQ